MTASRTPAEDMAETWGRQRGGEQLRGSNSNWRGSDGLTGKVDEACVGRGVSELQGGHSLLASIQLCGIWPTNL